MGSDPRGSLMPGRASLADRLCRWIVVHPAVVVGTTLAVAAAFGVFATRARIDSSVQTLLDPADPAVVYYEQAKRIFGSEESDVVAVLADDVFTSSTLSKIQTLSERLAAIDGVAEVTSLATVRNVGRTSDGELDVSRLMPSVPTDPAGLRRLSEAVAANPIFAGTLVSADRRMAAVLVRYADMSDSAFAASGIHEEVERTVAAHDGPERLFLVGTPTLKAKAAALMRADLLRFTPLTTLVIVVVLLLSFRTLRGLLLPMATTGLGLLCTLGIMGYFDIPIDLGTIVLPTLLTVVGSAYVTHVVARFYEELPAGGDAPEIAYRIIRHLGLPVLVTAATTVFGFASLIVFRLEAIRHLGIFAVFGISTLFVLALTFAIAVLALLRVPGVPVGGLPESTRLQALLERLGRFDIRHRRAIIVISVLLLIALGWGIRYVRVETNYTTYFPPNSDVRKAGDAIGEHLGGTVMLLITVDGSEPNAIAQAATLRRIATLQDFIDRMPGVDRTISLVDHLRLLRRALHDEEGEALPSTDAEVQQYLLLLDPEIVGGVVNGDYSRAAILVRTRFQGSRELAAAVERITRFAAGAIPPPLIAHVTGTAVLLNRTADDLSAGQVQSFAIALVVVFAILSLQFLSFRFGLVAMVPNLIPIVIFFGVLGWLDIPLSITTAMIASISLGIGVDEAVHLLTEFNHQVRRTADQEQAIVAALRSVGPPVVFATLALCLGFLVPVFSNFVPVQQFGALSALNVAPSLLADIVLLPALISSTRFVTLWDVIAVRLGRAPQESIPLLRGLRAGEARVAVLLGDLRSVAAGERIMTRGEAGSEMLVLIRGRAQVFGASNGRRVALDTIGRGDTIGEMGFVRHRPRTADIEATEDSEFLVVNDRFLDVLQRRYPRIAARVFLNLAQLMGDRLETTTARLLSSEGGS